MEKEVVKLIEIKGEYEPKERPLTNQHERTLLICGQEYTQYHYDWYILDAIELASRWKSEEITFDRITYLRTWIRENYQHSHNLNYENVDNMKKCKQFVEKVILSEYRFDDEDSESEIYNLKYNKETFDKSNNIPNQIVDKNIIYSYDEN